MHENSKRFKQIFDEISRITFTVGVEICRFTHRNSNLQVFYSSGFLKRPHNLKKVGLKCQPKIHRSTSNLAIGTMAQYYGQPGSWKALPTFKPHSSPHFSPKIAFNGQTTCNLGFRPKKDQRTDFLFVEILELSLGLGKVFVT